MGLIKPAEFVPLSKLFTRSYVQSCAVAGVGFLADAYDLFVINIVLVVLADIDPQTDEDKSMVASTALWGAVAGQLIFGTLADYIGRRKVLITTVILITLGAILSATCVKSTRFTLYQQLAVYRFLLGFGVGGEYPLSATYSSESSNAASQGKTMATVFSMQGLGNTLACLVMFVLLSTDLDHDIVWRLGLGLGALPALLAFYFRAHTEETSAFQEAKKMRVSHLVSLKAAVSVYWRSLLGTSGAWFLLDITFYGNGLFSGTITELMDLGTSSRDAALNALYVALMALPGYFLSIAFLDNIGRKRLQNIGFAMIASLYILMGLLFDPLRTVPALFLILYGMTFLFSNFGANLTTYVIPGELFPNEVRATCHGIAAASGKVGAAVAAYCFPPIKTWVGIQALLVICGVVALIGLVFSWLLVPSYSPLEENGEIAKRYDKFRIKVGLLEEAHSMNAGGLGGIADPNVSNERKPILGDEQAASYL
eukprot:m.228761 g.228761  ORF g.228761 m.228761 type:complete len:482 (+) comp17589_c0_seq1:282-1727(+)